MGLAIEQAAARTGGFDLIHRVGRENLARLEQDLDGLQADLIIDFSSPDALRDVARLCGLRRIPLVSGTTATQRCSTPPTPASASPCSAGS